MSREGSDSSAWEQLFWTVFNLSTNPILLFDEQRTIVEVNAAMCDLLGRARAEIVGRRLDDLMSPEGRAALAAEWAQNWERGHWTTHRDLIRSDGKLVPVQSAGRTAEVGGRPLGLTVLLKVPVEEEPCGPGPLGTLTPREREIVKLVALGHTTPEIAKKLAISTETVRTHVRNAMAKTGARTRAQLVVNALADRHIDPGV